MGRKRSYTPLNVFLNSRLVGQLVREPSGGVSFAYARDWLEWEHRMPVSLSLPLQENRYSGAPVLAVFDNLLPDSDVIRRRVAERVGAEGVDAFSLLSQIGRDCIGALQFLPDGQEPQPMSELTGEPVDEAQIGAILSDLDLAPLGIRRENDFRISVAGAQEKTALLRKDGQWIEPTGTTPTTHIIKPQIGRLPNGMDLSDSVENEYFCLKLMEAFGLRAANVEMAQFGDKKALVVERFDRRWTSDGRLIRLPQEDCCQALSIVPTQKYQNEGGPGIPDIMDLLLGSDDPNKDRYDFFKANVLFWLLGATDGHGKNFSVSLLPGGRFRMTPLYDVLTVQPTVEARQIERKYFKLAMNFGNSNHYKVANIVGRHIVETGVKSGFSRAVVQRLFEELQETSHAIIEATFNQLPEGFPEALLASIDGALRSRLPLLK
ncbi:type II toxin-antitoxin system HipA family toxin [Halocynthiibacter sp. C4]|uniref:type II toxin-antitoxin system HipA family toxin n=1 Tax=Halocynthiibacter sp. C4 TaxID=2992758 RepID=UPI00237A5FE0|nr:type II toxin-antitoxin system HipA family toxin [Halocynthiibacter sp. C4]MDE0588897.1 type II toxin-antitoxin system HipA family toxin [Halocynthiibacter sp. C4]